MATPSFFTVDDLSARFGSRLVLESVGFVAREGEILGLIGPNGAGKTTLFECLSGLRPVESGEVRYLGRALGPAHRREALFYMPDGICPWGEQPAYWALRLFERIYGGSPEPLIESLKLGGVLGSRVERLSKGERKRFLLALALLTSQPILALDEPFDGLDLRQTRDVMELLRGQRRAGRTLILSIHQLVDAERVCDRLVLLADGRVRGEGTLAQLRERANLGGGGLEEVFLALT